MVPKLTSLKRLSLLIGLVACLILICLRFIPTVSSRAAKLEHDLEQHFVEYQSLQLDVQTVAKQVRETGHLSIATSDLSFDLELVAHDLRAPGYRVEEFGPDGAARVIDIGPVRTFKGRAREGKNGKHIGDARFTIDEQTVEGLILTPTEHYFVEPARKFSEAATAAEYVVYKEADVVSRSTGECGITLSEQVDRGAEVVRIQNTSTTTQTLAKSNPVVNPVQKSAPALTSAYAPAISKASLLDSDTFSLNPLWQLLTVSKDGTEQTALWDIFDAQFKFTDGPVSTAVGCVAEPISSGQQLNRTLSAGCTFDEGQLVDIFTFSAIAGQQVSMVMSSTAFDTDLYLWLEQPSGLAFVTHDDNGAGGTDSRIPAGSGMHTLPATGKYYIYATSNIPNQTGNYTISFSLVTPPPVNDNFSNALVLSGTSGNVTGRNLSATKESGEPRHANNNDGGVSVWYLWQATTNGTAIFNTVGSEFDTLLAVYTGESVGSLTTITRNNDFNGQPQSRVSFATTLGTTYYIAVDGVDGVTGEIQLNWNPPPNDDFASAQLISGTFGTVFGDNTGASREAGEPTHGGHLGGASVWYRWVAPSDGTVSFTTKASQIEPLFAAYTGAKISALSTPSGSNSFSGSIKLPVLAGTTYYIALDGFRQTNGFIRTSNITLNWLFATPIQPPPPAPANDNFADAQSLNGSTGQVTGTNVSASREAGEPDGHTKSIWYKWQASGVGIARFTTSGSSFDTRLVVYTGSNLNSLTAIANNDDDPAGGIQSTVSFSGRPELIYYIAIDGFQGVTGTTVLNWTFPPVPANDRFANAQIISGLAGTVPGTNEGSSKESDEPDHAGYTGGASVWYKWQAPISATATFDTAGSDFDTLLGIYRGSNLSSLTEVARNDDALGRQSSATFIATAGTDYYIGVDGYKAAIGNVKLNFTLSTASPTPSPAPSPTPPPMSTPTPPFLSLQIATEADFEYVASKGGSAAAAKEILSILNQVEGLYESQLGLTLRVSYQSTWSSPSQPYTATNPSVLLSELANHWNINRGSVGRDVVHMWTGKELENSTIGTAYLEALCRFNGNGRAAYGLSRGVSGVQQIAITAHEMGHNLGATHPNQQQPQPAGCDNTVMTSSVSITPGLDFCPYSANEIANYLAGSINCLSREPAHLSFAVPKSLPIGPLSDAAVGDFNNDGKQDIAANAGDRIAVLLGSDNGEMTVAFNYPVGSSPAIGDFDGDGKQDLVFPSLSGGTITLLRGNGSGGFEPAGEYAAGKSPSHIVVGDFNVDGTQDLAAISGVGEDISVLLNNNSGGFQAPLTYTAGISPLDLFVGEFTGDNAPDLLVAGIVPFFASAVSVFRNNGTGAFQTSIVTIPGHFDSEPRAAVGDINGDGISDVVATAVRRAGGDHEDRSLITLFAGDGKGGLRSFSSLGAEFLRVADIAIGDFNGDSREDVAIAGTDPSGGVELWYGNGTSSLTLKAYNVPATGKLAAGDFNGDGNQDLVSLSSPSLVLGSPTELQAPNRRVHSFPTAIAAGDFNLDGKQDLVVVRGHAVFPAPDAIDPTATVLFGTGTGDFEGQLVAAQFAQVRMTDVTAGDFNNDGILDFAFTLPVTPSFFWSPLTVMLGNNSGFDKHLYDFVPDLTAVTAGDFNRDGKLDLAIAGNGRILSMYGGTGGVFQAPVEVAIIGIAISDLAAGDFNRDGIVDLAVAYESSDVVSVLLGTNTGGFLSPVNFPVAPGTRSITVGDFNFDHKLDLAVGGASVLSGNGDGTFRPPISFGGGGQNGIAAADFNGDGKTDIAVASSAVFSSVPLNQANKGNISVLVNNSGNSFSGPVNDDFANARIISGSNGTLAGTTVLATKESGELNHASASNGEGGASIWYRWRAPFTGRFYFQTFNSSFPSVIAAYTGTTLGALTTIAQSTSTIPEFIEFDATAGTTYLIAIDGLNGDTGRTVLTWNTGSLSNDDFAVAREIRGSGSSVNGNNTNFTLEPNEPSLPGPAVTGFSAWYRWTAPNTGKVSFSTEPCADTTRLLGAYTGNFIDTLELVAINFDGYRDFDDPGVCDSRTLRFNAVAGTTYRIQLRSVSGGPFKLAWSYANPPPNDNFSNALVLAGKSGSLLGTNRDATKEPGEPNHAGGPGGASIWYRWTAPTSGQVTFDTFGFRNQTSNSFRYLTALMAMYTGTSLDNLTSVVTNATDNRVTFNATAGTTYHIAIDSGPYTGGGYLPGILPLHWGAKQVANDDFNNAQPLTVASIFTPTLGSNAGATKETGEPNHAGSTGGTSVWYRWTALTSENVSFVFRPCITCTLSPNNALIGIYNGTSVIALTPVSASADSNHTFSAVRGRTYFIAVDSNAAGGTYEFSLVSSNISARNDNFSRAQVLSGNNGVVAGDNSGATEEPGEPDHANDRGGASVWYQWKAPASGLYTFDTFGSNFDTLLAVYTGEAVDLLSVVAHSDNANSSAQSRVTFDAKVNTTYFIAVDGKSTGVQLDSGLPHSQAGFILLNWNNLPPPVNDNFANAQVINGTSGNTSGRNTVASKEGGEPNHAGGPGGASVWYRWTAPSSGNFTFNTFGSDFNTLLGVYTGNGLTTLTSISSNDDVGGVTQSRVTFNAVAGTIYNIAVDGSPGVPGNVTALSGNLVLSWFPETGVSNDNFLSAQQLNGTSGSLAATNSGATKESHESNHAGDRGGRSVWYSWTAPVSGPVLFTTAGSDFDTLLAVYTGANVNQLTPVTSNDDSPYSDNLGHILTSSLTFNAIAGTTYRIAVDGSGGRFGNFALRWGPDAKISGQVSFIGGVCGSDKKVTMLLSGEDTRAVTFSGSGTYTFEHLRVGGNYSVRGVSEISANCLPLFLERAQNSIPLAGDVLDANFIDDGLRGGGSTSNITGHVQTAGGVGLHNIAIALSGTASRTVYTDNAGLYLLPNLPAGTYQVTPSKAGVVFTPGTREFTFSSGQTILDADFVTQDSFNISGQTRDQNGIAISGVIVTLNNGTQESTTLSDSNGFYAFDAAAGGNYTLTAAKAGLSFTPASKSINSVSANQKNVDFTVTQTHTLIVASVNPNSGVNVTVTPNDNSSQGSGTTQFTRTYNLSQNVSLTAPSSTGGNTFQKWLKDGVDHSTNLTTSVTTDANHTMTAVYLTTTTQTPAGQNVTVQLNGVTVSFTNVTGAGTTTIMPISSATAGVLPNGYQLTGNSIAFDISTTAIVQPPISVCFNVPSVTDATIFGQLRLLHNENGTLVDRTTSQEFAAKLVCATVNSLSPFVLASTTVQQLELLLEESTLPSMQATAVDAVLLLRDPFPVTNPANVLLGADKNTRVLVFVRNLQLLAGETAAGAIVVWLVDAQGQSHNVAAEHLFTLPGLDFSQLSFRLPNALAAGTCTIEVRAHGQVSNLGTIRIK